MQYRDSMPVNGEVWHYTTADGLIGILSNNVLWASSAAFMNDHREIKTGYDLWTKAVAEYTARTEGQVDAKNHEFIEQLGNIFSADDPAIVYVVSACQDGDNLTMWRNYTGNQVGFAVALDASSNLFLRKQRGMDAVTFPEDRIEGPDESEGLFVEAPIKITTSDGQDALRRYESRPFTWSPVIYETTEQEGLTRETVQAIESALDHVDAANSMRTVQKFLEYTQNVHLFKNPSFRDEEEHRISCAIPAAIARRCFLKFRQGNFGVVPYVELRGPWPGEDAPEKADQGKAMPKLPITRIMVGPSPYSKEAKAGVEQLLATYGYVGLPVEVSEIPFRR